MAPHEFNVVLRTTTDEFIVLPRTQTNIQSEYHQKKPQASNHFTFFSHISKSPSFSPLQSAYGKFHSTETALLKLTNDIMETIDSRKITILTALDMSAAFDTLDHITLLHRLQHTFGLSGYVISWIRSTSYLTDKILRPMSFILNLSF